MTTIPQPLPSAGASSADAPRPLTAPDPDLAAPPPDVQALLLSEHSTLPLYYDAQRAQDCLRSQREWPRLWCLAAAPP